MKSVFAVAIWLIVFIKQLLFWLWLWQLKEYHRGRFLAHFEAQKIKKVVSSFWRLKFPKFTKKIILLFLTCLLAEILLLVYFSLVWVVILTIIFVPWLFLSFQIPAAIWRKIIINKAKQKRAKFNNLLVIGITGSYGKTSTKEFLATILTERFGENKVLKTKEHQNSEVGISLCILNELKPEHEIFICEMAAYNRGGIKLLCEIVQPQIGILTGVNEQHMATFGSLENIIKTKYELIESLPETGFAVFNGDNEYCREFYKKSQISKRICYTKFFAVADEVVMGDYWVKDIKTEKESLSFKVFSRRWGEIVEFKVNLLGEHWAQNILMAAIVAKEILGMTLDEIAKVCQKIKPEQQGMRLLKGAEGLNIIDSTYSANPDGVIAHLDYLKTFPGKKVVVMPCLIELGKASKEVHRRIGKKIVEACDLAIITTKDRFKEIENEAGEKAIFLEKSKEIFNKIKNFTNPDDTILLESRVPQELIAFLLG